jgi:hypothetical protein
MKQILQYLKETNDLGIFYHHGDMKILTTYIIVIRVVAYRLENQLADINFEWGEL